MAALPGIAWAPPRGFWQEQSRAFKFYPGHVQRVRTTVPAGLREPAKLASPGELVMGPTPGFGSSGG